VLGGFGSVPGAIVGGFTLGLIEMLAGGYVTTALLDISGFLVIMVVLIVRPMGLFGTAPSNRV
jgi:branched-chain amino acid transport system permease protein